MPVPRHRAAGTLPAAPMPEAPMIALEDVDLTLPSAAGPVHILRGLSLSIARG